MHIIDEGTGTLPARDRALGALADVLEDLGDEAFALHGTADERSLGACQARAEAVTRAIVALPSVTLHGASAKARAARASVAGLMPQELVSALADNMQADVTRLRALREVVGHA